MAEWPTVALGDLADPKPGAVAIGPFGSRMKADCYVSNGVPVIRGSNISRDRAWKNDWVYVSDDFADTMSTCNARADDLVFPHRGSIGEVAIVPGDRPRYMLSTSLMKLRVDKSKANPLFLFYYFRSPPGRAEILRYASQVGTPGIGQPLTSLKQFKVPLPPLTTQAEVANLLASLDDKIELNRRTNETLEAMARAIFKDWFVDFGPTRAKMERHPPYLASGIWCLFPDCSDADGLPEGWRIEPLLDHAHLISGGTPKTDEPAYWNGPIQWASAKDISQCDDDFLITTERSITQRGLDESAARIIPKFSTVVVARGATTGRFCIFGRDVAMNQTCYALSSSRGRPFWLNCAFESLVQELVHAAHGSVFDTITTTTLRGAELAVADSALLDQFERTVEPLFLQVLANVEQSQTLAATRDLLLPKLMSGEIRIRDADKTVEAAA